jgi:hypothetical protein
MLRASEERLWNMLRSFLRSSLLFFYVYFIILSFVTTGRYEQHFVFYFNTCNNHHLLICTMTNKYTIDKLLHSYTFRHYRIILRDFVVS